MAQAETENRILEISKVYKNIKLEELAHLIGTSKKDAESLASKMIMDGRMEGQINQISEMIHFESGDNLLAFDKQIEILLQATNNVVEAIHTKYPDWMEHYKLAQNSQ